MVLRGSQKCMIPYLGQLNRLLKIQIHKILIRINEIWWSKILKFVMLIIMPAMPISKIIESEEIYARFHIAQKTFLLVISLDISNCIQ